MPTRQQLQRQIKALDEEINQTLARANVSGIRMTVRPFPSGNWGLVALCGGWWLFGDMISPRLHNESHMVFMYLGLFFGAAAVLRTLAWLLGRGGGELPPEYREATERVRQLQEQRRALQDQLKKLDEK